MNNIILIPSYEPDDKLIKLINKLSKTSYDVIVIDDGSGPKYKKVFNQIKDKCKLISYDENRGKGYALKTGFKYIKENYDDYVLVTMDSDGQHTIEDATKLLKYASANKQTLVTGMRKRDEKVPLRSRLGNGITRYLYRKITHLDVYDTQTGLRAFSNQLMDFMIDIYGDRFDYEMNILLKCAKNGIQIKEIQIQTIYIENNKGTHFKTVSDSYKVYKEIIKYILSSSSCFVIDYILYTLFNIIFKNIIYSNVLARLISSFINYKINKKIVFKSNKKANKTFIGYFSLVIVILILNTSLLSLLVNIGINKYLGKIITEIVLSIFSFLIQKLIVFKEMKNEA